MNCIQGEHLAIRACQHSMLLPEDGSRPTTAKVAVVLCVSLPLECLVLANLYLITPNGEMEMSSNSEQSAQRLPISIPRGGYQQDLPLNEEIIDIQKHARQIIDLDEYLSELSELDERLANVVELRFFTGLSIEETAEMLGLSTSTVNRDWVKARGWLYKRIQDDK